MQHHTLKSEERAQRNDIIATEVSEVRIKFCCEMVAIEYTALVTMHLTYRN